MNAETAVDLSDDLLIKGIRKAARPLRGAADDHDSLLQLVGDARFVLIGEASHGTHEFYRERAQITKRLIRELGFTAVAVEADWPDAYRVNRYARGGGDDADATDALAGFRRFPAWMWRNADVLDFIGWLRAHNDETGPGRPKVGFYGLDLYSLHASMAAVIAYLEKVDPDAANRARRRYACFDFYGDDPQTYGFATTLELGHTCENEVVTQLVDLRRSAAEYALRDGRIAEDDYFYAEQNAAAGQGRRAILPHDVPGRSVLVEPARPAHGRDARGTGRLPGPERRRHQGCGVGAQLPPGRRACYPDGGPR